MMLPDVMSSISLWALETPFSTPKNARKIAKKYFQKISKIFPKNGILGSLGHEISKKRASTNLDFRKSKLIVVE